jgi:hypothetical protein
MLPPAPESPVSVAATPPLAAALVPAVPALPPAPAGLAGLVPATLAAPAPLEETVPPLHAKDRDSNKHSESVSAPVRFRAAVGMR